MSSQVTFAIPTAEVTAIIQEVTSGDENFGTILAAGTVVNDMHTNYLSALLVKLATIPADVIAQAVVKEAGFIKSSFRLRDASAKAFKLPTNDAGKPIFAKSPPVLKDAQDRFFKIIFDEQARRREEVLKAEAAANAKEDTNGSALVNSATEAIASPEVGSPNKKRKHDSAGSRKKRMNGGKVPDVAWDSSRVISDATAFVKNANLQAPVSVACLEFLEDQLHSDLANIHYQVQLLLNKRNNVVIALETVQNQLPKAYEAESLVTKENAGPVTSGSADQMDTQA